MSEYSWHDFLSLGVEHIDAQHRRLMDIVNDFLDAVHQGRAEEVVRETAAALLAHTVDHFADEEAYMESIGYPDLETHHREHRDLRAKAERMVERVARPDAGNVRDMDVLLKTWLLDHILNTDLKIAEFTASEPAS